MKIIDTTTYFEEELMMNLRFNILNNYVDKFIVSEARFTHSGQEKDIKFNKKKFPKFEDKIIHIILDKEPEEIIKKKRLSNAELRINSIIRIKSQRDFILKHISPNSQEDYLIHSDNDEIPDLKNFDLKKNTKKYVIFNQKMYYYKINLLNKTEPTWYGSKICKKRYIRSPQWLRDQKIKKVPFWKFFKEKWNVIEDGGWHFSFLMSASKIKEKLNSYAHSEYNNAKFNDLDKINYAISQKIDLFDRSISFEKILFDDTFPEYILNNKEKFKNWIL